MGFSIGFFKPINPESKTSTFGSADLLSYFLYNENLGFVASDVLEEKEAEKATK